MGKQKKNKRAARKKKNARRAKATPKYTAKTADRHELYQLSVQAPEHEVEFLTKIYKKKFGKKPMSMREDFCGTALLCSAWVKSHDDRTATGVDFDAPTLDWGKEHNVEPLGEAAERVTLLEEDVRNVRPGRFDVINALNFSYWTFRTREELRDYFKKVRKSLAPEGLFLCDAFGGWEAQEPMLEPRKISGGFTYVWDQDSFDPITHEMCNYIHFEFKDGSKMEKAFSYSWRYWTLKEIQELLQEAGFTNVDVYWDQAEDEDDEKYRITRQAENQPGWLAYITATG